MNFICALSTRPHCTTPPRHCTASSTKKRLTFDYLPQNAPEADAILITVPDIGIARFRDAFASDLAAHHRLRGGSVTTADHTLILVAGNGDLDVARRLVEEAGGDWNATTIAHGRREFVN